MFMESSKNHSVFTLKRIYNETAKDVFQLFLLNTMMKKSLLQ